MRHPSTGRPDTRPWVVGLLCAALTVSLLTPVQAEVLAGAESSTLQQEPQVTPSELASDAVPGLKYADPTEGLSLVDPPAANSGGGAQVSYPILVPKGRGLAPELSIDYDSGGGSGWAGQGWDIGASQITVDTTFGVPKFCPRATKPACGNVESESYQIDGEQLMPAAVTSAPTARVSERSDFTRRVETTYDKIVRHGTSPKDYTWEVTDKAGDVFFYGMQPDAGGPLGGPGSRIAILGKDWTDLNDMSRDTSSILSDADGNAMTWYLTAQRDVGVNMMRYQYDTVYFKAGSDSKTHSTTWSVVPASDCTGSAVCAKHVYLKKIFYTGVAEASTLPQEDPAYVVELVRGPGVRDDAVLDARGGFLDLDGQQLTDITVKYLRTSPGTLVSTYHLNYEPGSYGKTQLASIDQVGCAGPVADSVCDDTTKATHTFTYYDDAKDKTLEPATSWDTTDNSLGAKSLENRASALGMSATNAGDGHLYLGFNVLDPSKTGSFGVSLTFGGGSTESLVEFMDINGDGLPDKVFRTNPNLADDDSTLQFALNTSKPTDPPGTPVVFGTAHPIAVATGEDAFNRLPVEHNAGFGVGLEAYFGVFGMFNVSGEWNWSQGYFNDVNGDGLPDYITAGKVRFNHLECSDPSVKATCIPTFGSSDGRTRVPLTTDVPSSRTTDPSVVARRRMLAELSPQIDTVRRWVAPYPGKVTIQSAAALLPCKQAGESLDSCPNADVRLAIQKDKEELTSSKVSATGDVWAYTKTDVDVDKGTALYFRMGADPLSVGRAVSWDPVVTYTSFGSGAAANPALDANGLSQKLFRASTDFTVAGRPGALVSLPAAGDVRFEAVIDKKTTSDDVRPTVALRDGAAPNDTHDKTVLIQPVLADGTDDPARTKTVYTNASQYCVKDGSGTEYGCWPAEQSAKDQLQLLTKQETGRFKLLAAFPVAAPVKNDKGVVVDQDGVSAHFAVDSPIDVNRLTWVTAPRLCYGPAGPAKECDGSVMDLVPPVDTELYSQSTTDGPRAPWTAPASKDTTVRMTVKVGSMADVKDRTAYLTVKTAHDGYVAKEPVEIDPVLGKVDATVTIPAKAGTDYWVELSLRDLVLPERLSDAMVDITPDNGSTDTLDLPVNSVGRQGIFPLPYRGWGVAGYLGNDGREATDLHQEDFVVTQADGKPFDNKNDACKALMKQGCMDSGDVSGMTFPGSYSGGGSNGPAFDASAVKDRFSKAYAYLPAVAPTDTGVTQEWQGPNAHLGADGKGQRSALLGGALPAKDAAGGGLEPPTLEGSTGPSFSVTGGVGPLGVSFGFGWSRSFVDYLDMNGDGFPDVVSTDKVTYTNPRGGQGCLQGDGSTPACEGAGVDAVNMDTTLAISGGFSGSPVSVKGNVHGVTSSTLGSSASKGGSTSADEFGANIGAGAEISASFGSPNTADPNWDENKVSSDSSKIPGQPLSKDSDVATQRTLADVNGDGLPDKVQASPAGIQVWFNLGYRFAATPVPWSTGGFSSNEGYAGGFEFGLGFSGWNKDFSGGLSRNASINFPRFSWTDVNGDGILDALHRDDTDGTVKLAYGTGTGLGPQVDLGAADAPDFRLAGDIKVPIKGQVRQDQSVGYGAGADVTVAFGPLCIALCYLIVNPGAHFENSLSVSDVSLEDVNGDGSADSVQRVPAGAGSNQEKLSVQLNAKRRTGLLEKVTNPLHGDFVLDYTRDGNSIAHPSSLWSLSSVTVDDGRNVDGPRDGADTSTTTFRYAGLRYDFLHREDAGYATVDSAELDAKGHVVRVTRDEYSNTDVFDSGQLQRTTLYAGPVADDRIVQRTTNRWTVKEGATGLPFDRSTLSTDEQYSMWIRPAITRTEQELRDATTGIVGQKTAVDYTLDSFGDPTTIVDRGLVDDPNDDITATIAYSDCATSTTDSTLLARCGSQGSQQGLPAFWRTSICPTWVHTPASMKVEDANGTVLRYRDGSPALCDNNSVTHLRQLISGSIGGGDYAETDLYYDSYGSYNRIVYPLGSNGTRYAVYYVYDDVNAANVAQVTDYELTPHDADTFVGDGPDAITFVAPSRQGVTTTSTFDGPSGRVASTMNGVPAAKVDDPVPPTTSYAYDALSRVSSVTAPDGGTVTYAYHPTDSAYAYATAEHDDAVNGGHIDTVAFADGVGRVTQEKRETTFFSAVDRAPTTGFAVTGGVAYDELGREVKQYQPRRDGGPLTTYDPIPTTARATVDDFDVLDRVTSSTAPGARTTTTAYTFAGDQSMVETETDPRLRQTVTTSDARQNVVAVADVAVGKPAVTTSYGYSRMGDLTTVTSGGRTQTTNTYDLLGRRLSTQTADGGTVLYGFDPAGNQVSSQSSVQDAAGTKTTYGFAFGHLVSVDYADTTPSVTLSWGGYDGATVGPQDSGRLVGVHDGARIQALTYDVNGQVATEGDTMVDDHWKQGQISTQTTHDYLGRLRTVTYPDQEKVTYGYDSGGMLSSVRGAKDCTDLGTLVAGVTATQTSITVKETALVSPPSVPFTFRIGSEQLRTTARTVGAGGAVTYTVERGINGTLALPTAAPHGAGSALVSDTPQKCDYRYVDRLEYDEYGSVAFQLLGNANRVQRVHDDSTRALSRVFADAPNQGSAQVGTLVSAAGASSTTMTVREGFAAPPLPFVATVGSESVRVTDRAPTATAGVFTWTVARGQGSTTAAAQAAGGAVQVTRVQQNLGYAYDKAGNVTDYVDDLPADVTSLFGGASRQHYEYDGYYRVKAATGSWDTAPSTRRSYSLALGYDAVTGNLASKTQRVEDTNPTCTRRCKIDIQEANTYTWDPIGYSSAGPHQPSSLGGQSYRYDLDGNVTSISGPTNLREMTWDSAGRMTSIVDRPNGKGGKPTYYTYDYQGRRAIEDKEQGRSWFVNPWVTVRNGTMWKNIWAGDTRVGTKFAEANTYESKVYYFQADLQGSTNVVSDGTGKMFQHQEYLPGGEVWVKEDSTVFRTPYQGLGAYYDEDHALSDLGQRWHDSRTQAFYGVDPAVFSDPGSQVGDPTSVRAYTFANDNPLANGDPDGAAWNTLNKTASQIAVLARDLKADDESLTPSQRSSFNSFFASHTGLRGKIAFALVEQAHKRAKFVKKWDMKPLFELTLGFEKAPGQKTGTYKGVENVKLGVGTGKRWKKAGSADPGNASSAAAAVAPAAAPPPDPFSPAANFKKLQALAAKQAAAPSPAAVTTTQGK